MYGESISEMLNVQYRMHAAIMDWSSQELYNGKLTAHASVASHTLETLQASVPKVCHLFQEYHADIAPVMKALQGHVSLCCDLQGIRCLLRQSLQCA